MIDDVVVRPVSWQENQWRKIHQGWWRLKRWIGGGREKGSE